MVGSRQDALRAPRGAFILVCLLLLQALLITIPVEMVGSVAADDDGDEEQEDEDKDEDEDEDEDEDRWDEESHSYQVEVEEDRVEIEIESENASVESKTKIKIDLEKSAFHLSFEEEADNSEVEQELELTFREVFEFEDSDGDGLHDEGESVLRSFVFSEEVNPRISEADEVQWQMPSVHDISLSGVEGEQVDLVASLGEGNTTFGIVMRIMTDPIELAAGRFVPTEVKMDFLIDDWAWGSNTSRLGLEMYVEAESETEVEGSSLVSRHGLNSIDLALGFSWVEEAEIDGSNLSVAHRTEMLSTSADEVQFDVQFGYAAGQSILHDPVLGARYAATALVTPGPGPGTSPGPGDGGPDNQTGSAGLLDGMISLTGSAMVLAILVSTIIAVAAVSVARRQSVEQLEADVIIPWLLPAPPVEVRIDLEVE